MLTRHGVGKEKLKPYQALSQMGPVCKPGVSCTRSVSAYTGWCFHTALAAAKHRVLAVRLLRLLWLANSSPTAGSSLH